MNLVQEDLYLQIQLHHRLLTSKGGIIYHFICKEAELGCTNAPRFHFIFWDEAELWTRVVCAALLDLLSLSRTASVAESQKYNYCCHTQQYSKKTKQNAHRNVRKLTKNVKKTLSGFLLVRNSSLVPKQVNLCCHADKASAFVPGIEHSL